MQGSVSDLIPVIVGLLSLLGLSIVFRVSLLVQQIQMHTQKLLNIVKQPMTDEWDAQPSQAFIERVMDALANRDNSLYQRRFGAMRAEIDQLFLQYQYQDNLLNGFRAIFSMLMVLAVLIIFQSKAPIGWRITVTTATALCGAFLLYSTRHISSWKSDWAPHFERWQKLAETLQRTLPEVDKDLKTSPAPKKIKRQ